MHESACRSQKRALCSQELKLKVVGNSRLVWEQNRGHLQEQLLARQHRQIHSQRRLCSELIFEVTGDWHVLFSHSNAAVLLLFPMKKEVGDWFKAKKLQWSAVSPACLDRYFCRQSYLLESRLDLANARGASPQSGYQKL